MICKTSKWKTLCDDILSVLLIKLTHGYSFVFSGIYRIRNIKDNASEAFCSLMSNAPETPCSVFFFMLNKYFMLHGY